MVRPSLWYRPAGVLCAAARHVRPDRDPGRAARRSPAPRRRRRSRRPDGARHPLRNRRRRAAATRARPWRSICRPPPPATSGAQTNLATMYLDGAGVRARSGRSGALAAPRRRQRRRVCATDPGHGARNRRPARGARRRAGRASVPAGRRPGVDGGAVPPGAAVRERASACARDLDQAAAWYRKAADRADPAAQLRLGILLGPGNGARTDVVAAHMWLNLSASRWKNEDLRVEAAARRDALEAQHDAGADLGGHPPLDRVAGHRRACSSANRAV